MIRRIVPNFRSDDPSGSAKFYEEVLGLPMAMDMGWISTFVDLAPRCTDLCGRHGSSWPSFLHRSGIGTLPSGRLPGAAACP
jgi:hypothetical protein